MTLNTSHYHYIGTTVDGVRCRFWRSLSDDELDAVVKEFGALPKGFWAWHIPVGFNVDNSQACRNLAAMPVVEEQGLFGKGFVDPIQYMRYAVKEGVA